MLIPNSKLTRTQNKLKSSLLKPSLQKKKMALNPICPESPVQSGSNKIELPDPMQDFINLFLIIFILSFSFSTTLNFKMCPWTVLFVSCQYFQSIHTLFLFSIYEANKYCTYLLWNNFLQFPSLKHFIYVKWFFSCLMKTNSLHRNFRSLIHASRYEKNY